MKTSKIRILAIILLLAVACSSCGSGDNDSADTDFTQWAWFSEMPEDMSEGQILNLTTRQQYLYNNNDGTGRVVLEVMEDDSDVVAVESTETVKVGRKKAVCYIYNGEDIEYPSLSAGAAAGILKPEAGETVIEWKSRGKYLRLFGDMSKEELLAVAETVVVKR